MTLTLQFLLVSLLPLSLLAMTFYLWRADDGRWEDVKRPLQHRSLEHRWIIALILAALWSSSVLRSYGGQSFSTGLIYTWGLLGNYLFSLFILMTLATTISYFAILKEKERVMLMASGIILLIAVALDPGLWSYQLPSVVVAGITVRQFDFWAAIWVSSWAVPLVSAWLLTRQLQITAPYSLYRNQTRYWLVVLVLLIIGGGFASIHAPDQPFWQQIGVLLVVIASLIGTLSIARGHLPDLSITVRQLFGRITGTLVIFGLTWFALAIIVRVVTDLPADQDPYLLLTLAAALFAAFLTIVYRATDKAVRRYLLPPRYLSTGSAADYGQALASLASPHQLGELFLEKVQTAVLTNQAILFTTADAPAGRLVLHPLTSIGTDLPATADFADDSPFTRYWRENKRPLSQFDINALADFSQMEPSEKNNLLNWEATLYAPLHVADTVVGLLALGAKQTGDAYTRTDFDRLAELSAEIAPFFVQAEQLAALRHISRHTFRQNQTLAREKQHLLKLTQLNAQFLKLIAPELRRPFNPITEQLRQLDQKAEEPETHIALAELGQHVKQAQTNIEQLVNMASRIQARGDFTFEMVRLDDIVLVAIRKLRTMAEARRVELLFVPDSALPQILGDKAQLGEAVQNLLHNAIKFNKIGGKVMIDCVVEGANLRLSISDIGVGISPARMERLWTGFSSLGNDDSRSSGTGLGLSLAQFIVTAHGGTIAAESEYGSGSTFVVLFPIVYDE